MPWVVGIGYSFVYRTFREVRRYSKAVRLKVTSNFLEGPINEILTMFKVMEIFFSIFTFFSFKVSLVVSFCTIASYFASSFYEITFLFATLCCIFGSLRSCLCLLVAYGFHLCNFIVVIFAASLLYKALSKLHYLCLLLHYFVVCLFLFCFIGLQSFCPTSHHCFPKFLERSSLFPYGLSIFLHVSYLLSIIYL